MRNEQYDMQNAGDRLRAQVDMQNEDAVFAIGWDKEKNEVIIHAKYPGIGGPPELMLETAEALVANIKKIISMRDGGTS